MPVENKNFPDRVGHTQEVIDLKRERVNQICELIAMGLSRQEIKEKTGQFDLNYRSYNILMRAAYNKIEASFQKTLGISVADLWAKYERVFDIAVRSGDLASANNAIKGMAAISGKNTNKVEVKVEDNRGMDNLSDDELLKLLTENTIDVTPKED